MKYILIKIALFSGFLLCMSCSEVTITPYWEIPDPSLPEIAMIRTVRDQTNVVIYNPDTCKEIGDACGFFRLHAYAHDILEHTLLASPAAYPASMETQADCYAAKYGKPQEIHAAVQLFLDPDRNPDWKIYGDPVQRAERVRTCAMKGGKWIGNE